MGGQPDYGETAMVFDYVGHYEAIGCCEALIDLGVEVTYVTRHLMFAPAMEATGRTQAALQRFHREGKFRLHTQSAVVSIEKASARIRPIFGTATEAVPADTAVRVGSRQSQSQTWQALHVSVPQIHTVGDVSSSGSI